MSNHGGVATVRSTRDTMYHYRYYTMQGEYIHTISSTYIYCCPRCSTISSSHHGIGGEILGEVLGYLAMR
jgi:hypothetical protein